MTDTVFPVESFKEGAAHLRRPFTAAAVKFKVQSTWPKDNPTGGLVVGYIDARLAVERLNLVLPHLWIDEYQPVQGGLLCRLTIDGLTRHDIGEGVGKGLYSDALKRAAVKFGVGVSLYAIPQSFIGTDDGTARQKRTNKGPTLVLTDQGEAKIRAGYKRWLDAHGIKAFGEPLDHGDVEGAQGDAEADTPPASASSPTDTEGVMTPVQFERMCAAIAETGHTPTEFIQALGLPLDRALTASEAQTVRGALDALTSEQAA